MAFNPEIKGYMTFGKSFSRGGAFPLEAYEIWTDYDALVAYAANTDPSKDPSYIGQKVAYIDTANNKVVHYGIEIDGTLKELGCAPMGDEKTIAVAEDGTVSLKGIEALEFERDVVDEEGNPTGQKENVQFQPLMTKDGLIWVEPSKTTVEGLAALIEGLTVRVSALENDRVTEEELAAAVKVVADKVGVPAEDDESTATLYERIAAEILRATQAEETLGARIGVAKDGETAATGVYAYVDGVVNALVNGVDPDKIDSLNELIAWVEAHPDIVSGLDERLDKVEGVLDGFGGEEQPATVKGYVDDAFAAHNEAADGKYATKQEIIDAGYAVAADVARDYATKQALTDHETAADGKYATKQELTTHDTAADAKYATKEYIGTFTTGEDDYKDIATVVGYINKKAEETLAAVQGSSSETVASVKLQLDNYKTENDAKVQTNANEIAALRGQLTNTNTNVSNNTTEIGKINTEITTGLKPRLEALEGADEVIEGTIAEHTAAIKAINETTIPALQGVVSSKAAQADVDAINQKIGAVTEGKTVVDMINEVAGTIDFTPYAKTEDVAKTYATIVALNEEIARADAAEKANAKAVTDLTNGAVKKNTDDIAAINALLNTVDSEDTITSLKELAIWVEEHDTEVIPVINEHTEAIETLEGKMATVETAVETTLPGAITQALTDAKAYVDEKMVKADGTSIINNEGTFSIGTVSTDNLVQGTMTLVLNGGDAQVTA